MGSADGAEEDDGAAPSFAPFAIRTLRAVAQTKPVNYEGAFHTPDDSLLERVWWTMKAYTVRRRRHRFLERASGVQRAPRRRADTPPFLCSALRSRALGRWPVGSWRPLARARACPGGLTPNIVFGVYDESLGKSVPSLFRDFPSSSQIFAIIVAAAKN